MDNLPAALRTGTPTYAPGENPYTTFPSPLSPSAQHRWDSHGERRVSALSILYAEPEEDSFPHEQYRAPRYQGDPPPSHTRYESAPGVDAFVPQGAAPYRPARKHSLLSKIGSIRSTRRQRYGAVSGGEERSYGREARHKRLVSVDEEEGGYGIDLSNLDSPIGDAATSQPSRRLHRKMWSREIRPEDLAGVLGNGMDVLHTGVIDPSTGRSLTDVTTRRAKQIEAEKSGRIVVVEEVSGDISSASGGHAVRRNNTGKTSYFFPPDPEQPSWRPFSMGWPYIVVLIVLALLLGGLQEYLCQISMHRAKMDDGLLRFMKPQDLTVVEYFAWKYMPTAVLLIYGIMWQVVDFEVKRLEPYYQLSKKNGATARDSLNMDYITFISYLVPFKAFKAKQWAVVLSSMATLLAGSVVPILQSASVVMLPTKQHRHDNEYKFVRMDPPWSRALSVSLALVALAGILLLLQLRRRSGLLSDPKGIAGIASMATRSHILNDFQGMDVAPNQLIHDRLLTRRYNLYRSSLWQGEMIKAQDMLKPIAEEHPHPVLLRKRVGVVFIGYMLLVAALIPTFVFVPRANLATEKAPWLLTALATAVKLSWGTMDMNLRVIEPYYILSRGNAPPKTLTMDYTGTVPGWLSYLAFRNGQHLTALVGLGAIVAEVLTVCVTSFSVDGHQFVSGQGEAPDDMHDRYNTDQTFRSFWVSYALATAILLYLVTVAGAVYVRRSHKFLPRQPGTIAGVLAYIHASRLLDDFVDTEEMDSRRMKLHLEKKGKRYGLGWFMGRDGVTHCGVDEEELLARYTFGKDFREGRVQGNEIGGLDFY